MCTPLETAVVDYGIDADNLSRLGDSQPGEGIHRFRITASDLIGSRRGFPCYELKLVVVETLHGERSVGGTHHQWLRLPIAAKQDARSLVRTQGWINRFQRAIRGSAGFGDGKQITREWVQSFVGEEFVAHYFPFIRAVENSGVELASELTILLRNAPDGEGGFVDEVEDVISGRTILRRCGTSLRAAPVPVCQGGRAGVVGASRGPDVG